MLFGDSFSHMQLSAYILDNLWALYVTVIIVIMMTLILLFKKREEDSNWHFIICYIKNIDG